MRLHATLLCTSLALGALASSPTLAHAEDDLVLMTEPTTYTDVIDAFDDNDVFDVHISVGYLRNWEFGRIQREVAQTAASDGREASLLENVGGYELQRNGLLFGLDVGIFRDLAVYAQLPLILSDDRTLTRASDLLPNVLDAGGSPAFDLPSAGFRSPTRSGVDWLGVGLAWSILNQARDVNVPTWLLMIEGRFNIGEPMRACQSVDTMLTCTQSPGVSRGVNALRIETRSSFRTGMVEPYAGLMAQIEWPGSASSSFLPAGDLRGYINRLPPIQGRFTAGVAVIPWEDRQHFQRFTFDLRFNADYISEGRDYSPLFDALGSSSNPHLTTPTFEGVPVESNPTTDGLATVQFNGMTDTQSHARIGGQIVLEMQAAQYVRFQLGSMVMYSTAYNLTQADACNPNVASSSVTDPRLQGDCRASTRAGNTTVLNPAHRPVIDSPGSRFRMGDLWNIDLFANVTAMF